MVFSAPAMLTVRISRILRTVQTPSISAIRSEIRPGRRSARDGSPLTEKIEDHDVRVLIFGMGREVAIAGRIPVLVKATTNRHDLPRTVQFSPLFNLINGL